MARNQDDEPPPLEDMSHLVGRIQCQQKITEPAKPVKSQKGSLLDDSFTLPSKFIINSDRTKEAEERSDKARPALRRGFLNSSETKKKKASRDIPLVKATGKPSIPSFMRVQSPLDECRRELQSMLKPTQELVSEVLGNEEIKTGLDDPEVMAAVQEIAGDPGAIRKYRNNAKVTAFYSHLGKVMGDKIERQNQQNQAQRPLK